MGSDGSPTGWTTDTYAAHNEALRAAKDRFDSERDRRYADVAAERDRALKIKEEADKATLLLAREIQTYKDEKANELREQINSERGHYATKEDLTAAVEKLETALRPLQDFVSLAQGRGSGIDKTLAMLGWVVGLIATLIVIGSFVFRSPTYVAMPLTQQPQTVPR